MTLTAPSTQAPDTAAPAYAGLATRTVAFGADALLINAAIWVVGAIVALGLSLLGVPKDIREILALIGAFVAFGWTVGYFVFFWSANGQTPGNRMMGISVRVAGSLEAPGTKRSIVRLLALPLSAIPLCAGFLLILVDRRRCALHDRIAGTVVIYMPRSAARTLSADRRRG
jgi:uncharacterized RDD family membrane protein YckC